MAATGITPERKRARHIETLRRRAEHLQARLAGQQSRLSWDVRELNALRWALALLDPEGTQ